MWPDFFYFRYSLFGKVENIALCLKKYHKNERQTFTECVLNQYTNFDVGIYMSDLTASYDKSIDFIALFGIFLPNVTTGYVRFSDLIVILRIFMYYYMFETL